ncbi:MAG: hypothetical protein LUC20_02355 [Oscillospiraceae bacterium]|nr:hypothetical protein [Oscillospiraceae bacterium]
MSARDRAAEIAKYEAMFDECDDVEALVERLGTPTRVAVSIAAGYVPSPEEEIFAEPDAEAEAPPEPEAEPESAPAEEVPEQIQLGEVFAMPTAAAAAEDEEPAEAPTIQRRVRPVALAFYLLFAVIIGIPVAIVLICFGVPFMAMGVGTVAGAMWCARSLIAMFSMFSDVLLTVGAAAVCCAVGLVVTWLGLWISIVLGRLWIGSALIGWGRKACWKEAAEQ